MAGSLGFVVQGLGSRVLGFGFWGWGSGFGVWGVPPHWVAVPPCPRVTPPLALPASRPRVQRVGVMCPCTEGRHKATWKRKFKLPWRRAGQLKSSR